MPFKRVVPVINPHELDDRVAQLLWIDDQDPELGDCNMTAWELEFLDSRLQAFMNMEDVMDDGEVITSAMIFTRAQEEVFDRIWKQRILDKEDY